MLPPGQKLIGTDFLSAVHSVHFVLHAAVSTHRYKVTQFGADAIHPERLTIDSEPLLQLLSLPVVEYRNRFSNSVD